MSNSSTRGRHGTRDDSWGHHGSEADRRQYDEEEYYEAAQSHRGRHGHDSYGAPQSKAAPPAHAHPLYPRDSRPPTPPREQRQEMTFQQLRRELAHRRERVSSRSRSREHGQGQHDNAPHRRYLGQGRFREVDNEGTIIVSERAHERSDSRPRTSRPRTHQGQQTRRRDGIQEQEDGHRRRSASTRSTALRAIAQILRIVDEDEH